MKFRINSFILKPSNKFFYPNQEPMIKHVVMWRFEKSDPDLFHAAREEVRKLLEGLPGTISDIQSLEIGMNINSSSVAYDMVLITTHIDQIALKNYQEHPDHQAAARQIGKLAIERVVVDFEY